jgi:hypothetical protein
MQTQFITDKKGNKIAVIVPIVNYPIGINH